MPRIVFWSLLGALAGALLLTGPTARTAFEALGGGDHARGLWSVGKWPLIVGVYVLLFLRQNHWVPRPHPAAVRPPVAGRAIAAGAWALALAGFAFYLVNLHSLDETLGATIVPFMWLTLFSVLYYATPRLGVGGFGTTLPGLAMSLGVWLTLSAGLALSAATLEVFSSAYSAIALGAGTLAWLLLSNLAILLGVGLNLALVRRQQPAPLDAEPGRSDLDEPTIESIVRAALEDDTAHRGMWSALPGTPEEVPARLSELECDLNDWGFAYGVAWAVARWRYPQEPDAVIAERALKAARAVFGEYCAGEDWSNRLADRQVGTGMRGRA